MLMALAFSLIGLPTIARTQLTFDITPAVRAGVPGETVSFDATLINTGNAELFLNSDSFNLEGSWQGININDQFFTNVPLSLAPSGGTGSTWTGRIFDVAIGENAQQGDYFASLTILGGADNTASIELASRNFQVSVVPAPSALFTASFGAMPIVAFLMRRRQSAR